MADRKSKTPVIRLHRARSDWSHNRTTGAIRSDFRNNFFNRLRNNRSRSVDRFRQIVENYGELITYRSVTDLRAVLAVDPEASRLMEDTEVNEVLAQIEHELAHVVLEDQGDKHLSDTERETHDILQRHLNICHLCKAPNSETDLCRNCSDAFQKEFRN